MKRSTKEEIINFLIEINNDESNIFLFDNTPINTFKNIPDVVDLTIRLIDSKEYLVEKDLLSFSEDFFSLLYDIINVSEWNELPRNIQLLSDRFEPFLRIISFYKGYYNTIYWKGNEFSKGILGTSFAGLCMGLLENTSIGNKINNPQLKLNDKLFNYRGSNFQQKLADFVKNEFRNPGSHKAPKYDRSRIVIYSQRVVYLFFLVISDNFKQFVSKFSPINIYLNKVVENSDFKSLDNVYVELFGDNYSDIEIQGTRVADISEVIHNIEKFNLNPKIEKNELDEEYELESDDDTFDEFTELRNNTPQNILELSNKNQSFYLIGDPGSGKSTTLLKILYQNSKKILDGENIKIPIYITANEFTYDNSFKELINKSLDEEIVDINLKSGNLLILVDGLNEISAVYKTEALRQLNRLVIENEKCSFIFSERKISFRKIFDIEVYELRSLENEQIKEFVYRYSKVNGNNIWLRLEKNTQLMELAHNPLMLKMILSTSKSGEVPLNKGRLYDIFIKAIFEREERKRHQISIDFKLEAISRIAYLLRKNEKVSCNKFYFKEMLKTVLINLMSSVDLEELLGDLKDNYIIKINEFDDVSFVHESYLEYFVAYALMVNFKSKGDFNIPFVNEIWIEPINLCMGLVEDENQVMQILKSLCVGSFVGGISIKKLNDFNRSDFNEHIYLPAKVSNECKDYYPKAFETIENIVKNYLVIWKNLLYSNGQEPFDINFLFKAVACINSEKIFRLIFMHPSWVYLWLYSDNEEDINSEDKSQIFRKKLIAFKDYLYKSIVSIITKNITDISILLKQIDDTLICYKYNNSICIRLFEFKKILIDTTTYNSLKVYYRNNLQVDILVIQKLIQYNLDDVSLYKFESHSSKLNKNILITILTNHYDNDIACRIVIDQLKTKEYPIRILKKIVLFFFQKKYYVYVLELAEFILFNLETYDDYLIDILQQIDWEALPEKIRTYFSKGVKRYKFEIIEKKSDSFIIRCDDIHNDFNSGIFSKSKEYLNSGYEVRSITPVDLVYDFVINKNLKEPTTSNKYDGSFDILIENVLINIRIDAFRNSKNHNIVLTVKPTNKLRELDLKHFEKCKVYYENKSIGEIMQVQKSYKIGLIEISGTMKNSEIVENYLHIEIANDIKINEMSIYEIEKIHIHPSIVERNIELYNNIIEKFKLNRIRLINWLCENKLINYYLSNHIVDADFGLITNNNREHKKCSIYFFKSSITKEIDFQKSIEPGNVVLLDSRNNLHVIILTNELKEYLKFKIGKIIMFDNEKDTGFISVNYLGVTHDYFFSPKSCQFNPKIGLNVKFISAPNPIEKYKGKQVAFNISNLDEEFKLVELV